jgi:hypothetical protein
VPRHSFVRLTVVLPAIDRVQVGRHIDIGLEGRSHRLIVDWIEGRHNADQLHTRVVSGCRSSQNGRVGGRERAEAGGRAHLATVRPPLRALVPLVCAPRTSDQQGQPRGQKRGGVAARHRNERAKRGGQPF